MGQLAFYRPCLGDQFGVVSKFLHEFSILVFNFQLSHFWLRFFLMPSKASAMFFLCQIFNKTERSKKIFRGIKAAGQETASKPQVVP